jgi:hypothetical protein
MNHYADERERARLVAGLRDLAEFLARNPRVPAPRYATVHVFPPDGADAGMFAEIDAIAGQIAATAVTGAAGHYVAVREFGPVQYRAVAIPNIAHNDDGGEAE